MFNIEDDKNWRKDIEQKFLNISRASRNGILPQHFALA